MRSDNEDVCKFNMKTCQQKSYLPDQPPYVLSKNEKFVEMGKHLENANRSILILFSEIRMLKAHINQATEQIDQKMDTILTMLKCMPPSCGEDYKKVAANTDVGVKLDEKI